MRMRSKLRKELYAMSDQELHDIGFIRCNIEAVVRGIYID